MKKQKVTAPLPEPKTTLMDKDLAVLVFAADEADLSNINKNIAAVLLRSRPEASLIICGNKSGSGQESDELAAKGRLKCINPSTAAFVEAMDELKTAWVVVADGGEEFDLAKTLSCYSQHKKSIYCGRDLWRCVQ